MTISGTPIAHNEFATRAFQITEHARDRIDAASAYFFKHLSPEDVAFINSRGIHGEPLVPSWCADSFVQYLYQHPTDSAACATHPMYYSAEVMQRHSSTIESMNFLLGQPYLDEKTKATLRQSVHALQIAEQTVNPSCREQMTRLLENAKAAFVHRGVAGEQQVAETIDTIDAVLRNIKSFEQPGMSEQSAEFYRIYDQAVKQPCEYAIANGRNPFRLEDEFYKVYRAKGATPQSYDAAWQTAMESVRPQTRYMAEQLKDLLRPYAQISPTSHPEDPGPERGWEQVPEPRTRSNSWDMV